MKKDLVVNPDAVSASKVSTSGQQWYTYGKNDTKFTDYGYVESTNVDRQVTNKDFKGNRQGKVKLVKRIETERVEAYKFVSASTGSMAIKAAFYGAQPRVGKRSQELQNNTPVELGDTYILGGWLLRVETAGDTGSEALPEADTLKENAKVTIGDAVFLNLGKVDDNEIVSFSGGNKARDVSAIHVMSTEESDGLEGKTVIMVFPHAQIQGTGTPDVQDFDGYEFTLTVSANLGFRPIETYGNFEDSYPDTIVSVVPNDRVEEVVNAYARDLITYRDKLK